MWEYCTQYIYLYIHINIFYGENATRYCPFVPGSKSAVQLYRYQTDYCIRIWQMYDIGYTVTSSTRLVPSDDTRYQPRKAMYGACANVKQLHFLRRPSLNPLSCFKTFVASYPLDATKQITHTTFHEDDTIFHYVRMFRWFDRLFGTISTSTTTTTT